MRQAPFTMYGIFLILFLGFHGAIPKEVKILNGWKENEQDLKFSDNNKSYQYVAPPALLTVTPVISQRILTDSTKKYDHEDTPDNYLPPSQVFNPALQIPKKVAIQTVVDANPLVAALLLSSFLGIEPKYPGFNHPQHLPPNPYIALLLSHYGRYIPLYGGGGRGIYGYSASNNYHNNKPFGAYKIYEDNDT